MQVNKPAEVPEQLDWIKSLTNQMDALYVLVGNDDLWHSATSVTRSPSAAAMPTFRATAIRTRRMPPTLWHR